MRVADSEFLKRSFLKHDPTLNDLEWDTHWSAEVFITRNISLFSFNRMDVEELNDIVWTHLVVPTALESMALSLCLQPKMTTIRYVLSQTKKVKDEGGLWSKPIPEWVGVKSVIKAVWNYGVTDYMLTKGLKRSQWKLESGVDTMGFVRYDFEMIRRGVRWSDDSRN